ncbi:MAG: ABC transporter ATP-binding protein [Desulfobacteraceae bacterium]|nr:ABC transporter ATP-binding protein [Desulfobacteraceae bacterium]
MNILLSDVYKSYREADKDHPILSGLSAVFDPGRFYVILGKSGSGKSTLLNLISGVDTPDKGSVHIGGRHLSQMTDTQRTVFRRRHIGFIFQFFNLIPTLSVLENVTLVSELDGKTPSQAREHAAAALQHVGLDHRMESDPDRLSGGEQQRVAIARALANRPEVILADEPTGNLDETNSRTILEVLASLVKDAGSTLIMATHSREAVNWADSVLTIENLKLTQT